MGVPPWLSRVQTDCHLIVWWSSWVYRSKNAGVVSRQTDGRTNPNYSMIFIILDPNKLPWCQSRIWVHFTVEKENWLYLLTSITWSSYVSHIIIFIDVFWLAASCRRTLTVPIFFRSMGPSINRPAIYSLISVQEPLDHCATTRSWR